jgi:hypothetical protein
VAEIITDNIATESWQQNGGSVGALRELAGRLVIGQTDENHQAVARLLAQLRQAYEVQDGKLSASPAR